MSIKHPLRRLLAFALLCSFALHAAAPPGVLNHQGRIVVSGINYMGTGHFKFALVDAAGTVTLWSNNDTGTGGAQPTAAVPIAVSQGHYALGLGDTALANMTATIPPEVFTGNADVRLRVWFSANAAGPFEQLTPDRRITATGYALTAGAVADPSFIGTTTNAPLDFSVNNLRAIRVQPGNTGGTETPNLIGGSVLNTITAGSFGSVIGGGGRTGEANSITADARNAVVGGGKNNIGSSNDIVIAGGANNRASAPAATVAGGNTNVASGTFSAVSGGQQNTASNIFAIVPGGFQNTASGITSFAAGNRAKAINDGAFVWADSQNADFTSSADNQFLIRAAGGVGINTNNPAVALDVNGTVRATAFEGMGAPLVFGTTDNQPLDFKVNNQRGLRLEYANDGTSEGVNVIGGFSGNSVGSGVVGATIAGGGFSGFMNHVGGDGGTVSGGIRNASSGLLSTVGGGFDNTANNVAAIGGGESNTANGGWAAIPGGRNNFAGGDYSFAAGNRAKATNNGTFVWADSQDADFISTGINQFNVRAAGGARLFTGGTGLKVDTDSMAFSGSAQVSRFGPSAGFDFNTGQDANSSGLLIEQGLLESSGIFFDGDSITLWSPGDNPGNGNRLLRILDEDEMGSGAAAAEKFYVDGSGGFGSAGSATIAGTLGIGVAITNAPLDVLGRMQVRSNGTIRSIPTFGGSFSGMIESFYADNDRYGLGQLPNGITALYTSNSFASSSIQLGQMTGTGSFTPQMLINHEGAVGIGTTSPAATLVVSRPLAIGVETSLFQVRGTGPTFDNRLFEIYTEPGQAFGSLRLIGPNAFKTGGGSWAVSSDARLKKNVDDLHGSLDRLLRLRSVSFEYQDPAKGAGPQIGFIAQEVREVLPQWITEGPDGMLAVSVTGFESMTVDALRELRAEKDRQIAEQGVQIAEMKTENTALRAESAALKERLERLERAFETMRRADAEPVATEAVLRGKR